MEYVKRLFARVFKFRIGGFKTFSRLVFFHSDDDLKKKLKEERGSFFVDYNRLRVQHEHIAELQKATGFRQLFTAPYNQTPHSYV
jgi:hypothetical protein